MTASIRILTTTSLDSNPSLLIVSPNGSKTLINCGEGCQRSFLESASAAGGTGLGTLRISSVNRVCLTHIGHDSLGGLPGMILTSADVVDSVAKDLAAKANGNGNGNNNNGNRQNNGNGQNNNQGNNNNNRKRQHGSLASNNDEEGAPDLEIVGPNGTNTFLHSLRHFMRRDRFKIHAHEGQYDSSLNANKPSQNLKQKKQKAKKKKFKKEKNDNEEIGFDVKSIPVSYESYPDNLDENDPSIQDLAITKEALSYLFTTPPIPGKFLIDKALELNVPRGPMFGQLKGGKNVTFVDPNTNEERTVTSEEVVAKSSPGVGVGVLYCPTLKVLEQVKETGAFSAFEAADKEDEKDKQAEEEGVVLDVMVHLTPKSIFHNPVYQAWCKGFGTKVDHITLHAVESLAARALVEDNSPFVSGICGGIRRSFVHEKLYPMPVLTFPNNESNGSSNGELAATESDDKLPEIKACPMMEFVLMPRSRRGLNESSLKSLYSTDRVEKLKKKVNDSGAIEGAAAIIASSDAKELLKENESDAIKHADATVATPSDAKEEVNINAGPGEDFIAMPSDDKDEVNNNRGPSEDSDNGKSEGELIFTGTGSAVPCKHRNVTGKYLRMKNGNSIILDIGEGTVGQLLRSWKSTLSSSNNENPINEYNTRLKGIKAVWISHPHADHHLGLLRLLSERAAICGPDDPIVLMAPHDMFDFLEEYRSVVPEINRSYIAVECRDMVHGRRNPLGDKLYDDLGITLCMSIPVAHCQRSYAIVIDGTSFGRVAYSGDCRPSNRFADVAHGSDLLIHEATFEIGMEEDAVMKRHSTVGEAIDVASKMNAKSLVLTHFSQRYPKIPPLKQSKEAEKFPIAFAFDFMRLTPDTIGLAANLTPALRLLYPGEEVEEAEISTEKATAKELMAVPGVFALKGVL